MLAAEESDTTIPKSIPTMRREGAVKKLSDNWPALHEGLILWHEEVENVLGVSRRLWDYRDAIACWRIAVRPQNILIKSLYGKGYIIANSHEKIITATQKWTIGVRFMYRSGDTAKMAVRSELDTHDKVVQEFLVMNAAKLGSADIEKELRKKAMGT